MRRILVVLCCLMSMTALAASNDVTLLLEKIFVFKVSEKGGDELYMDFLVYPSKGKASHFLKPRKPLHWPSFMIKKLKNVVLWQGTVPKGEKTTFHVSLLEKDAPPWNRDDLIGSFILILSNEQGKVSYAVVQDKKAKKVFSPISKPFLPLRLTGHDTDYVLRLKWVETDKLPKGLP